jgi:Uncharacterised protein family (UPF0150).
VELLAMTRKYRLPVLVHQEDNIFVAECPLFFVAGQGHNPDEAVNDVKIALRTFIEDKDFEKVYHNKIPDYTPEEVLQKAKELYLEYGEEELPDFDYTEVDICIDNKNFHGIASAK